MFILPTNRKFLALILEKKAASLRFSRSLTNHRMVLEAVRKDGVMGG